MVPDRQLDVRPVEAQEMEHERELLKYNAENLRAFYSLTGAARKDYTENMAQAEASRVKLLREAQAQGLLAMRKAEAEGYKLIGEALAALPNARDVIEIARLHTVQRVADYLADGQATKVFLPQGLDSIFSVLGIGQEVLNRAPVGRVSENDTASGVTGPAETPAASAPQAQS